MLRDTVQTTWVCLGFRRSEVSQPEPVCAGLRAARNLIQMSARFRDTSF